MSDACCGKWPADEPRAQQFLQRVKPQENGCWHWEGARRKSRRGTHDYGWVTLYGKQMNAHRASWLLLVGPIGAGLFVCHHCDIPQCVNPQHLFLGTHTDNMQDMARKGRARNCLPGAPLSAMHAEIIEALRGTESMRNIASRFGVSRPTIAAVNAAHQVRNPKLGKKQSATGVPGVYKKRGRFFAQPYVSGVRHYLGYFDSFADAQAACVSVQSRAENHVD